MDFPSQNDFILIRISEDLCDKQLRKSGESKSHSDPQVSDIADHIYCLCLTRTLLRTPNQ